MKTIASATALLLVAINLFGFVNVLAQEDCEVTSADPDTYIFVDPVYIEDRGGNGIPGSGLISPGGGGTWIYLEDNDLPGLQRGGGGPGGVDPIKDETCGAGPDMLIF